MNYLTSEEFQERGKQITAENLQLLRELGHHEVANDLEVEKIAIEEHRQIEAATGLKFNVAEGANDNVAAFVETQTDRNFMVRNTLGTPFAMRAARHEQEHRLTGIYGFDLSPITKEDEQKLCDELNIKKLDSTELVEGFNELSTIRKYGYENSSGYADKEVPMAMKLEKLALEHLNISLLDTFRAGNAEKIVITLQQLAIKLRLQEVLFEQLAIAA